MTTNTLTKNMQDVLDFLSATLNARLWFDPISIERALRIKQVGGTLRGLHSRGLIERRFNETIHNWEYRAL